MTLEDARPTAPNYPLGQPGEDISLYAGPMRVAGVAVSGRVWMSMTGEVAFRWAVSDRDWRSMPLGDTSLAFDHSQLGPLDLPGRVTSTAGRGSLSSTTAGSATSVDELTLHWIGLPAILPAAGLSSPGAAWAGRWEGSGGGWSLRLDARHDHADIFSRAQDSPGHVVTHVGTLRRADGRTFSPQEAEDALAGLHVALSFALGRWVAPALSTGHLDGRRVWELWSAWRCDPVQANYAWWDTHTGDDLRAFAGLFLDAWTDPARHDRIRHVAHHLVESNKAAVTLEARIMLVGAALEYLSWVTFVVGGGRSARDHPSRASDKLRELLIRAGIETQVPAELEAFAGLPLPHDRPQDGPEAVAWVRNRLVHPKDAREPYRLEHLVLQTWQLLMHYGELLVLHELGYTGRFKPRYPLGRWAHDSELVPWALADETHGAVPTPSSDGAG